MNTLDRPPHVSAIVDQIKSQGIFDALRKECLVDVDTKPSYQNLRQKVENACASFLSRIVWSTKINRIQLREQMRKSLEESGVLQSGVKRIVNQVLTPKIDKEVKPMVAQFVCEHLGVNPDDIHTEEDDEMEDYGHQRAAEPTPADGPVTLYPSNALDPPPTTTIVNGPPPLPGFGEYDKLRTAPDPSSNGGASSILANAVQFEEPQAAKEETDKQEDMDISERSDSRSTCTSRASTKKSMDMDCTVTSDEEAGTDGADLSKGLAAYMATTKPVDSDDMSISSSEHSSKQGHITPERCQAVKDESSPPGWKTGKRESPEPAPPERREMRRLRTRNKKYMSEDFESIFTEKKELLSDAYNQDCVEEEIITTDDMMKQVVIDDPSTQSPRQLSEGSTTDTVATTKRADSPDTPSLRRSTRLRSDKDMSPNSSSSIPDHQVKSVNSISKGKLESNKALRTSKSAPLENTDTCNLVPRRYTRSTAKQLEESLENTESSGSTPTLDEQPEKELVQPMVMLSDICAKQTKLPLPLPTHTVVADTVDSTSPVLSNGIVLVKDEITVRPPVVDGITTSVMNGKPTSTSLSNEQLAESYEPELHFDEMSRAMTEQAAKIAESGVTQTLGEPTSPERLIESPTSPTPSSPTEPSACTPIPSSSVVTIPLEGDESYQFIPQSIPLPSGAPLSHITIIPADYTVVDTLEQPPLPPELPPLPVEPEVEEPASPPHEPEDEEDGAVFHVLSEVGADDGYSPTTQVQYTGYAEEEETELEDQPIRDEYEEDDLEELERLAQKKMEILKAIELPDSVLEKPSRLVESSEEEGEISDSSGDERSRAKKKKSKKSKKKKNKKESKKRKYYADLDYSLEGPSKRSKYS